MDWADRTFCKLCLKSIIDRKFQVISEVALKALSVLSLNVSSDGGDNYMCNDCSVNLFAAYDFKIMCLNTEDSLVTYVDFENAACIDLSDVYLKVRGGENVTITVDQRVCRLCLHIVDDGFVSLEKLCGENMADKYIPEINFSITKDPIVCKQCWNSLIIYIGFVWRFTNMGKNIKIEAQDPYDSFPVKFEEVNLKFEENNEDRDTFLHKSNEIILKDEIVQEHCVIKDEIEDMQTSYSSGSQGELKNCPEYALNGSEASDSKTSCELDLLAPQLQSRGSSETCSFQAQYNRYLNQDIQMYKCNECNFQSKKKRGLQKHQIRHKDPSEIQMYKCSECDFQSKSKYYIKKHLIMHKDPSEVQMYKCSKCGHQNKSKNSLRSHQIVHRDPSEIQMYKCDSCDYRSKNKYGLQKHKIIHKDPSEMQVYKCSECDYQTNWKTYLKKHQVKHKSSLYVQMFKCKECDFQSKRRDSFQEHQIIHKKPLEMQMYRCSQCEFQSNWKHNLLNHQLMRMHKDVSEIQKYTSAKSSDGSNERNVVVAPVGAIMHDTPLPPITTKILDETSFI